MDDYYIKTINNKQSSQILELQELILEESINLIEKSQKIIGRQKHLAQALKHDFVRIFFDDAEALLSKEQII